MTRQTDEHYRDLHFSEEQRATAKFREHLGGGTANWEKRGRFQVALLARMGLLPCHRLLDIGCGPIRAGVHFIEYLDAANYCGIDYNADFIEIAKRIVADESRLAAKQPTLTRIEDFRLDEIRASFDFALAFSVLNHSTEALRKIFFEQLPGALVPGARAYVTHASWHRDPFPSKKLVLKRLLRSPADIHPDLDMRSWGWEDNVQVFPILEIERLP